MMEIILLLLLAAYFSKYVEQRIDQEAEEDKPYGDDVHR